MCDAIIAITSHMFIIIQQSERNMNPKLMLLELRRLIAAGAEAHTLLYFVDHMYQLLPTQDRQQSLLSNLQHKNAELEMKIRQVLKERNQLDETLKLVQVELQVRTVKNEKLERQIKKIKYEEARRTRKEKKEEEKRNRERIDLKKQETDVTQDEESTHQMVELTSKVIRSGMKYSSVTSLQDESSWLTEKVDLRDKNPELQSEQWGCVALKQYAIVRSTLNLAVNIVQPKISNTKGQ